MGVGDMSGSLNSWEVLEVENLRSRKMLRVYVIAQQIWARSELGSYLGPFAHFPRKVKGITHLPVTVQSFAHVYFASHPRDVQQSSATGGLNWLTREQVAIIYHSIAGEDQQAGISAGEDLSTCFGLFRIVSFFFAFRSISA